MLDMAAAMQLSYTGYITQRNSKARFAYDQNYGDTQSWEEGKLSFRPHREDQEVRHE